MPPHDDDADVLCCNRAAEAATATDRQPHQASQRLRAVGPYNTASSRFALSERTQAITAAAAAPLPGPASPHRTIPSVLSSSSGSPAPHLPLLLTMVGPTKVMVQLTVRTRPHPQGKRDGPNRTPVYRFSVHVEALDLKTGKVPDSRVLPRLCARIAVELHETFNPPVRDLERQPDGTYLLPELDAWGSFTGKVLFEFHNEIHASIHMGFNVDLGTPEASTVRALVVRLSDADRKKYLVMSPVPSAAAPARKTGSAGTGSAPPPPAPSLPAFVPAPPMRAAALAAARRIPAANAASPTAPSSSALSSVASSSPSSASSVSSAGGSPPLGATRSRGPTPSGARSIKEPAGAGQARANATVRSAPASARPSAAGPRTAAGAGDAAPPRRASTSAASRRPLATSDAPAGFPPALHPPPRAASTSASSARGTASASARPSAGLAASARPMAGPGKSRPPPSSSAVRDASRTRGIDRSPPPTTTEEPRAPSRSGTAGAVKRPLPLSSSSTSTTDASPPPAKRARTESLTQQQAARRGTAAAARGFPDTRTSPPSDRPSPSVRPPARKPSPALPSPPESAALVAAPPPPSAVPTSSSSSSSSSPGTVVVAQIAAQIRTLRIDDVLDLARLVHAHADDLSRVMTADAVTNALQFHVAAFSPALIEAVVAFLAEPRGRSGARPRSSRPSAVVNGMQAAPAARMITS
ncbi:hypothetical protein GGF31_007614 [Allomyces arbusculus]|nr:hypothetical protein GGF31_007614 [Allomyces arbusculus]